MKAPVPYKSDLMVEAQEPVIDEERYDHKLVGAVE